MGNPIKGEVSFERAGRTYTLVMDYNALCTLQEELGLDLVQLGQKMNAASMDFAFLRHCVWAGLQQHHDGLDLREAGRIIGDVGVTQALAKMQRSLDLAFPSSEAVEAVDPHQPPAAKARAPRGKGAGTSKPTTAPGAGSA